MRKHLQTAILFTLVTTLGFGLVYPLLITALAQLFFPREANGSLMKRQGEVVGSSLLAQPFTGPGYFHPRPSAAGPNGYDPLSSGPSNDGPTSQKLIDRVRTALDSAQKDLPGGPVPVDLVTASGSGLDPHITPAAALYQSERVSRERRVSTDEVRALIAAHTEGRWLGVLGEPRVNVLGLNLALDDLRSGKVGP
jgi:K+-transporting ATPase ATPase C chain